MDQTQRGEKSLLKCILPITKQNVFLSIPLKLHRKKDPEMQKVIINGNYVTLIMYCWSWIKMSRIFTFFIEYAILKFYFSKLQQIHKINPRLVRKGHSTPKALQCCRKPNTNLLADRKGHCLSRFPQNLLNIVLDILVAFHFVDKGHHLQVESQNTVFPRFPMARQSQAPLQNPHAEEGVTWGRNYSLGHNLPARPLVKGTLVGFLVSSSWARSAQCAGHGGLGHFSRAVSYHHWHCYRMFLTMQHLNLAFWLSWRFKTHAGWDTATATGERKIQNPQRPSDHKYNEKMFPWICMCSL